MRLIFSLICIDIGSAHILSNLRLNKNEKKDGVLTASYETTIDLHVSHITRLFLADELNKEWNSRLSVQRTLSTREHGEIVYHLYDLPWPLSPRELLMKCDRSVDHRAHQLTSSCYSVEDESLPKSTDAVRVELRHTEWRITSLPDERTHIQLFIEIPASAAIAVPNFIVRYCQRSLLRDSVTAFLQANDRLQLPPHPSFIGWQRSRSATSKARDEMKRARQQVGASLPQITRSPPCARVRATLGPNAFSDACTHHH